MQQENKEQQTSKENEVDLGVFYNVVSRTFKKIGHSIAAIFDFLGTFIFQLILLIKKNIIWLVIAAAIGFGTGIYLESNNSPSYLAEMVIKTNFGSSRLLYQKIDYFNSLISQRKHKSLSKIFDLTEAEVVQLQSFKISSIEDPLQVSHLYKSIYLERNAGNPYTIDTIWARTMDYKTFSQSLLKYDFPLHLITLSSHNSNIYAKIQKGIIQSMQENTYLIQTRSATLDMIKEEEDIINTSLKGIDSLRSAYYKKIERAPR